MPILFTSNFHYHYRMPNHEYEPMGGMPNGGIGPIPIPIPIPPMGGGGAKLPPTPGPPIPGIGGAGKARGSSCAYIFCKWRKFVEEKVKWYGIAALALLLGSSFIKQK